MTLRVALAVLLAAAGAGILTQATFRASGSGATDRSAMSKMRDVVSICDYETTCPNGSDDSTALNAAIAALSSGGTVLIPVGAFNLGSTISTSLVGITIAGTGYGSKIKINHANDAFVVTGQLFRVRDLEIQINTVADRTNKAVLHFQAGQGDVRNLRIVGNNSSPNNGIAFLEDADASDNWTYDSIRITGGSTYTSGWKATAVSGTVATTQISNSTFVNGIVTRAVIDIDGAIDTFIVSNCDFPTYGGYSVWAQNSVGAGSGFPRYIHFSNTSIEGGLGGGNPTTAIKIDKAFDFRFTGGYVASGTVGLAIGSGVQYMTINGNHFVNFNQQAITVDAAAQGVTIANNTFMDASQASSGTYEDILVNAGISNLSIINNFFNTSAATKPQYHINLAAGATNQYELAYNRQGAGSTTSSFVFNGATGSNRTIVGNPGVTNTFSGDQTTFNTQVNINSPALLVAKGGVQNDSGDLALSSSTGIVTTQRIAPAAVLQANLGTPGNGQIAYCSDCTISNPCAGSGTGAIAERINGVWVCTGGVPGSEHDFCAYNAANLAGATAFAQTGVTNASTLVASSAMVHDIAGAGTGTFVAKLCSDGVTCAGGNVYLTCTAGATCAAAVAGRIDACTVTKANVSAGTTLTWSVGTACGTTDPGINVCAHMTTP